MRQAFAITFILIHLFNLGGHQLVFNQLENNSQKNLVIRLDSDVYSESELIEVKVPISLPYQVSQTDFERFDGEVEVNGTHYNYVKRKIQNDTLIVLCIPNTEKTSINTARETFFSLVNDINNSTDSKSPAPVKTVKSSVSEFYFVENFSISQPDLLGQSFPAVISGNKQISVFIEGSVKPPESGLFIA